MDSMKRSESSNHL